MGCICNWIDVTTTSNESLASNCVIVQVTFWAFMLNKIGHHFESLLGCIKLKMEIRV